MTDKTSSTTPSDSSPSTDTEDTPKNATPTKDAENTTKNATSSKNAEDITKSAAPSKDVKDTSNSATKTSANEGEDVPEEDEVVDQPTTTAAPASKGKFNWFNCCFKFSKIALTINNGVLIVSCLTRRNLNIA